MKQVGGIIQQKNFSSTINTIGQDIVVCQRRQNYNVPQIIDCFGLSWCLLFVNEPFQLRNGGDWKLLEGSHLIFIPPFAIIETRFQPGWHEWTSVMSPCELKDLPKDILSLALTAKQKVPKSIFEIIEYFFLLQMQGFKIEEQKCSSAVAKLAKNKIQLQPESSIQNIAEQLGYSRFVMSRAFKQTYGWTPVEYRMRLRIFYFLALISKGHSITHAIIELGIEDHKSFLIQFKKFTGISPRDYRPKIVKHSVKKNNLIPLSVDIINI
jgi:AraC-like DNA-binding protein